jgi:hypothetical protein
MLKSEFRSVGVAPVSVVCEVSMSAVRVGSSRLVALFCVGVVCGSASVCRGAAVGWRVAPVDVPWRVAGNVGCAVGVGVCAWAASEGEWYESEKQRSREDARNELRHQSCGSL